MTGKTLTCSHKKRKTAPIAYMLAAMVAALLVVVPVAADNGSTSLNFESIPAQELLTILAELHDLDLVVSGQVPGMISISLEDRSIRAALDEILIGTGFTYHISGTMLRIIPDATILSMSYPLNHIGAEVAAANIEDIVGDASLSFDPSSNTLSAVGPARDLRFLSDALAQYDVQPKQVQIQAKMIELNIGETEAIGFDWSGRWDEGDEVLAGSTDMIVDPGAIALRYTRLTGSQAQAVLEAITIGSDGEVIFRPLLVTTNQSPSKILVGERVPYTKFTKDTESGATLEEVDFVDVGILLEVTPLISEDSIITLVVRSEISEVLDKEVQGIPRIGTREAEARVSLRHGETAAIGGLRKTQDLVTVRGIPFLSKIPVLGRLFRNEKVQTQETELLIFLSPRVVGLGDMPLEIAESWEPSTATP